MLQQFNDHMKKSYRTSYLSCMDETGPMWHGEEGEGNYNMCPHVTVVHRKPEPVCAEFNTMSDAIPRIMCYFEFEKAAVYHGAVKYMDTVGSYNAALAVRMSEGLANKNAAVYGDARFGSVKAAYYCKTLHGVESAWDIKTGSALFPRAELVRLCPKEHGSIVVMEGKIGTVDMYAWGQRRGPAVHTFLSTFGTFKMEVPSRYKNKQTERAPWLTPEINNVITKAQPGVDAWNRQVFDLLGMQYSFTTRCFETRFSLHTMLPATYVNTVNALKYFYSNQYGDMETKPILIMLATQMVHNTDWLQMRASNPGPSAGPSAGPSFGTRTGRMRSGTRPASMAAPPRASLQGSTCSSS